MFVRSKPQRIKEEINNLLKKEHPIFKRVALHMINYHYEELNELFWGWVDNPLDGSLLKHELYELLRNNCSSFSKEQIAKVLQWIESKDYYIPEDAKDNEEQVSKILAYSKKEWLSALLDLKNQDVILAYEKYNQVNPTELEHPGFTFWVEAEWSGESLIERVEFLNKSNEEIAEYISNFKGENGWRWLSEERLPDTFKDCVARNPKKFTDNIKPFLNVPQIYQHALFWGLNEAWRSKRDFDWQAIFNFTAKIVESDDFWNKKYVPKAFNYRSWTISQIAELIENGTKNDNQAFELKDLPSIFVLVT